jgi:hypothetical protein
MASGAHVSEALPANKDVAKHLPLPGRQTTQPLNQTHVHDHPLMLEGRKEPRWIPQNRQQSASALERPPK